MRKKSVVYLSLLTLIVSSCTKVISESDMSKPNQSPSGNIFALSVSDYKSVNDSGLSDVSNKFGFKIFSQLLKTDSAKNMIISPASISMALTMTYNGADGTTKEAMEKALELNNLKIDQVNNGYKSLIKILSASDKKVKFNIANSLWSNKGTILKDNFIKNNEKNFDAKLTELDFSSPEALTTINGWVSEKTEKKIPTIIEKIDPATILFLINAIYFKGQWSETFDKNNTTEKDFNLTDGKKKKVSMMFKSGNFQYLNNNKFQAVELPYGDGKFSMYIFLPNEDSNLDEFNKQLNQENWKDWLNKFSKEKGKVYLPKFKSEYEKELNESLKAIGMDIAFSPSANFNNMTNDSVSISEVKHKTFIEVNEEGTEAAAATSVAITKNAVIAGKEFNFNFNVNRPFFSAIVEKQTGTILFMGEVLNP